MRAMATFDAHRKLTGALGDEGAEAVAHYTEESTRGLATRADLAALRADFSELRGDVYRALWIQAGAIVMINGTVVASAIALAAALD